MEAQSDSEPVTLLLGSVYPLGTRHIRESTVLGSFIRSRYDMTYNVLIVYLPDYDETKIRFMILTGMYVYACMISSLEVMMPRLDMMKKKTINNNKSSFISDSVQCPCVGETKG